MTCDDCGANLWTRDMLFQCALFAMKAFGLALTLFLSILESQLVVALSWNSASLVLLVWVWFQKRRRKPPNGNKKLAISDPTLSIPPNLPLLANDCERGREATNIYNSMRFLPAPCKGLTKAKSKRKIESVFILQHLMEAPFTQQGSSHSSTAESSGD